MPTVRDFSRPSSLALGSPFRWSQCWSRSYSCSAACASSSETGSGVSTSDSSGSFDIGHARLAGVEVGAAAALPIGRCEVAFGQRVRVGTTGLVVVGQGLKATAGLIPGPLDAFVPESLRSPNGVSRCRAWR